MYIKRQDLIVSENVREGEDRLILKWTKLVCRISKKKKGFAFPYISRGILNRNIKVKNIHIWVYTQTDTQQKHVLICT